jgi:cytochrome P450
VAEGLRLRIESLTRKALDRAEEGRNRDPVADLAHPLPMMVVAKLLGMPIED